MGREQIIELLGENWPEVRRLIRQYIHSDVDLLNRTNEAVLENSGKMLRPIVTLLAAGALSGINGDSLRIAAFTEMLHNATLMHDDVTDESRTRRGRPSVMSLLGPSAAVLIGDFWLARSMEILMTTDCRLEVEGIFSRTITDLAEGEMLQLEKSMSLDTAEEDYFRIIYCKTASLFRAACEAAAVSVGAGEEQRKAICEYGRCLGIAFQIKDDIMDYDGADSMGKPRGADLREQKITLPLLGALKNAPEACESVLDKLSQIREHPEYCAEIHDFVIANSGLDCAIEALASYVDKAVSSLSVLPDSPYKEALVSLAEYNIYRQK